MLVIIKTRCKNITWLVTPVRESVTPLSLSKTMYPGLKFLKEKPSSQVVAVIDPPPSPSKTTEWDLATNRLYYGQLLVLIRKNNSNYVISIFFNASDINGRTNFWFFVLRIQHVSENLRWNHIIKFKSKVLKL